ncbi:MAG TPA: amidohydrolase family protein [Candidatus Eisenbacteria bacterium]|nr:amidohydrolase family protein [Candidatus Eisenbacteria bacterium]
MSFDLVVRGGRVVDGTGMPSFSADVAVRDGRIARIGRVREGARRVIDADGCIVAPGFIDVHTHYDAQLHWEPTASPASWHGVTTVLTGNCGFTLAPAKSEDVGWLAQMLSRVEGMSAEALAAGLRWSGGTFGHFLHALEGRIAVNMGAYVGHSAIRRQVMGDAASDRRATDDEVGRMQALVRQSMHEGAIGFSTSQLDIHVAHDGREVPSNHAAPEEIVALSSVLGDFDHGAIEFIPRSFVDGYSEADRRLLHEMYRVSGRPIELNTLVPLPHQMKGWRRGVDFCRETFQQGIRLHPMFATNQLGAHFALDTTFLFDEMPIFRETLCLGSPERERRLRDPAVRQKMLEALADPTGRAFVFVWQVLFVEAVTRPEHQRFVGMHLADVADAVGKTPLDAFLDLALAEDLQTQFVLGAPHDPARDEATAELLRDPIVMAGSSDGGAHVLSFTGADYTTRLLSEWVPGTLSLEEAISKLTMVPAVVHGLADRGVVREGAAADLVVFDRARLRCGATRLVRDFPAGAGRYVVDAEGYVATVVNGEVVFDHGRYAGSLSGHVLRG